MPASAPTGQTLGAQLNQLRAAGCRQIYREKVTRAHNDRRELLKMLKALAPGDVVTVTRMAASLAAPLTCSLSSNRSWTPTRNFDHSRSRGPTPAPAPDD